MFPNTPLQTGVDFPDIARAGAVNAAVPHNVDSRPFGTNFTDNTSIGFGRFVAKDVSNGFKLPISGTTVVGDLVGVVAYENTGIIEDAGLKKGGLYKLVPLLTFGRIFVPVTTGAVLNLGDVVSLNLIAGAEFNTVRPHPGSPIASDLNISSIASVAAPSAGGFVELTIKFYIQ